MTKTVTRFGFKSPTQLPLFMVWREVWRSSTEEPEYVYVLVNSMNWFKSTRKRLRTLKWRLTEVVHMSRGLWNWEEYKLAQQMAALDTDIYEIRTPAGAKYLEVKWPGYPFVIYGNAHYGKYDLLSHCLMWYWWVLYIVSGEYENDLGRAEDEQLLAYARG